LPGLSEVDLTLADLCATSISPDRHPLEHLRDQLRRAGLLSVGDLERCRPGRRVHVAGLVTHRQRPGTAMGTTFLNLEDETGMLNVVGSIGVMKVPARRRATASPWSSVGCSKDPKGSPTWWPTGSSSSTPSYPVRLRCSRPASPPATSGETDFATARAFPSTGVQVWSSARTGVWAAWY
jgi:hypothetical protein